MTFPKIELHVHLEGTVRAGTLLQIARRQRQQIGDVFDWSGHAAGQP